MSRTTPFFLFGALCALGLTACSEPATNNATNNQPCVGKCDGTNNTPVFADLNDKNDPAADFFRTKVDKYGGINGDLRTILDGVGQSMGCDAEQEQTFTILLSNKSYFPRNMVTHCSDDPRKASTFFLSTQSDDGTLSDINPRDLKIAAWDDKTDRYNLYELKSEEGDDGPLTLYVDPPQCMGCHGAPSNLDAPDVPFTPIMNELTNPWTLWNAEPDFRSHKFDMLIDPLVKEAPIYTSMIEGSKMGSAATLETIMRSALDRVAKSRYDQRKLDANLEQSLDLLRPLFCDEVVNYASENHDTSQIQANALIDTSITNMFIELGGTDWTFDFVFESRVRFGEPESNDERIAVIPVRGDAMVAYEKRLVARGILTPHQVLRLRALDWHRPVFSEFRCNLYKDNVARLEKTPPMASYETNADWMPVLFEELMMLKSDEGLIHLKPADETALLALSSIESSDVTLLQSGELDSITVSVDVFGESVDLYVANFKSGNQRPGLDAERQRRGCYARKHYASAPEIPQLGECP